MGQLMRSHVIPKMASGKIIKGQWDVTNRMVGDINASHLMETSMVTGPVMVHTLMPTIMAQITVMATLVMVTLVMVTMVMVTLIIPDMFIVDMLLKRNIHTKMTVLSLLMEKMAKIEVMDMDTEMLLSNQDMSVTNLTMATQLATVTVTLVTATLVTVTAMATTDITVVPITMVICIINHTASMAVGFTPRFMEKHHVC